MKIDSALYIHLIIKAESRVEDRLSANVERSAPGATSGPMRFRIHQSIAMKHKQKIHLYK